MPIATPLNSGSDAVSMPSVVRRRLSAEKPVSIAFCRMIDRPKVVSSGANMSSADHPVEQTGLQEIAGREHQRQGEEKAQDDPRCSALARAR